MAPHAKRTLIKSGANRAVFVEHSSNTEHCIVKRYRARSALQRLRDRSRARHEFDLLTRLTQLGLAVPAPLGVQRAEDGAWELSQQFVADATSLEELIEQIPRQRQTRTHTLPITSECFAERLGRLMARAHDVGLDHADLHPGNFLCDAEGLPWLIDFAHAHIRTTLDARKLTSDIVELAAATRERVPIALRRRFLIAWRRALTRPETKTLGSPGELGREIETRARARRRVSAIAQLHRWTGASGICRPLASGDGWIVRSVPAAEEHEFVAWARAADPSPSAQPRPGDPGRGLLLIAGGRSVRDDWIEMGRAAYHALPGARPLLFIDRRPRRAVFACPAGAVPASASSAACSREPLRSLLHDRGFAEVPLDSCYVSEGTLFLHPGARLRER